MSADLSAGTSNLNVFLTDGPINFEHAFIDLQMVEVKVEKDSCNGLGHDSNDDHGGGSDDNSGSSDDNGSSGNDDRSNHDVMMITAAAKHGKLCRLMQAYTTC